MSEAGKSSEFATWESFPTKRGFEYFFGHVRRVDGHFHCPKDDGRQNWQDDREVSAESEEC